MDSARYIDVCRRIVGVNFASVIIAFGENCSLFKDHWRHWRRAVTYYGRTGWERFPGTHEIDRKRILCAMSYTGVNVLFQYKSTLGAKQKLENCCRSRDTYTEYMHWNCKNIYDNNGRGFSVRSNLSLEMLLKLCVVVLPKCFRTSKVRVERVSDLVKFIFGRCDVNLCFEIG